MDLKRKASWKAVLISLRSILQIAFELDFTVCPVALKLRLMTSWVVVCDVWYVEPQTNDAPIGFSEKHAKRTLLRHNFIFIFLSESAIAKRAKVTKVALKY
ncbi:hypothetical protein SELMODRAFT_418721 [Selaginella moellendorffii]|uniref:Uncharacterized protein n=1 Tax=Selaginella moellendorffii TaxID=88036 RepID=D8S6Y2_SELML|nr:hypothetical protein SELMODRAFT_418721 [Selaginella moellendorffii]